MRNKPTDEQLNAWKRAIDSVCDDVENGKILPGRGALFGDDGRLGTSADAPCCILGHCMSRFPTGRPGSNGFMEMMVEPVMDGLALWKPSALGGHPAVAKMFANDIGRIYYANDSADFNSAVSRLRKFAVDVIDYIKLGA